jgi:hypothetical protein
MRNPVWEIAGAILFAMLLLLLMTIYLNRITIP